jgi:hypothetical protein
MSFTFPAMKALTIMGIAEIALGILLIVGVLRSKQGMVARIVGGIVLIAFGLFFAGMRSTGEIRLDEGLMHLRVPFQKDRFIETAEIRAVTEVNTYTTPGMKPVRKISGGNIGDVRTGWFRLENGEKAFLTLEGPRALYVETTLGFNALVGCDEFESFEKAFSDLVFERGSE